MFWNQHLTKRPTFHCSVHANITDAVLHDLSTFIIDNVHVNMFTLKAAAALSLPTLSLDCNYYIDSSSILAELFPLYGGGPCRCVRSRTSLLANRTLYCSVWLTVAPESH